MKVEIDRKRCMGSGVCQFHAPGTFELDTQCKATLLDPPGDSEASIRNAAEGCPTHAIELSPDEEGG